MATQDLYSFVMRIFLCLVFLGLLIATETAVAEKYTLKSGETLANSEYSTLYPLGGKKALTLEVTFQSKATDPDLRNASLIEILLEHLLPKAVAEGYSEASIWETKIDASSGAGKNPFFSFGVKASAHENYDFSLQDKWIWAQTAGPELDLSSVTISEFTYDEDLDLFTTQVFPRQLSDGNIILEVWANAPGASPAESIVKANELFRSLSGCVEDGVPISEDSPMADEGAIALRMYLLPHVTASALQYQPRVKLTYGHEDGVATCYTMTNDGYGTWEELYASLSK